MRSLPVAALCAAVVLTGCAAIEEAYRIKGPVMPQVMVKYEQAKVCCATFAEIEYESLNVPAHRNNYISFDDPAYMFATGKSYFKAFAFPKNQTRFVARVQSTLTAARSDVYDVDVVQGTAYHKHNTFVLVPVVTLLDADHQVTRTLTVEPKFAEATRHIELRVEPTADERFMIVHTDPAYFGRSMSFSFYPLIKDRLPFGPEGNIRLLWEKRASKR